MAAFFLIIIVLIGACGWESTECLVYIHFNLLERHVVIRTIMSILDRVELFALLSFPPLLLSLVVLALCGSDWQVPLLKRLAKMRWPLQIASIINSGLLFSMPLVGIVLVWALSLTHRSFDGAKVYFLYDRGIPVPRCGYALGLCRISMQAERNWGKDNVVLDSLTKETLRVALKSARVLILATHGERGFAATYCSPEVMGVWPAEIGARDEKGDVRFLHVGFRASNHKWRNVENLSVNSHLQLTYIFACNAGTKAPQWREHLAPALVFTYNRFSTVWDHAIWFAFTGPSFMKTIR